MKTTKQKAIIQMAENLLLHIEQYRLLTDMIKDMKEDLRDFMDGEKALKAGDILILVTDHIRSSIDKKALASDLGKDIVARYEKKTNYTKMVITKA